MASARERGGWSDRVVASSGFSYLFNGDQDDVAGHDLDDVDFQQPPDEELQLVEILQELEEEHGEAVDHQVPFVLQVWLQKTQTHRSSQAGNVVASYLLNESPPSSVCY